MRIESLTHQLQRGLVTNTDNNAAVVADYRATATKPTSVLANSKTGRVVLDFGPRETPAQKLGPREQNTLVVLPIGGTNDNTTLTVKVSGWRSVQPITADGLAQYVSTPLCTVAATLSINLPGNANRAVVAADLFADALTLSAGTAVLYQGTADVDPAMFLCDISGFELVTIDPFLGTAAGANCLFATL